MIVFFPEIINEELYASDSNENIMHHQNLST